MLSHWKTRCDINFALNCSLSWKVCRGIDIQNFFGQQLNKHSRAGILSNTSHRKGLITSVTFVANMLCMGLCFGNIWKQKLVSPLSPGKGQLALEPSSCWLSWCSALILGMSAAMLRMGAGENSDTSEMINVLLMVFNRNTNCFFFYMEHVW